MTAPPSLLATGWTRIDKLLGGLAVFGVILYVLVLPAQHPDAAASYTLGEAAAVESARVFLAESGYVVEEGDATISLRRQTTLLNALQKEFGRRETIRLLQDDEADGRIPAYYWRVQFMADTGGRNARRNSMSTSPAEVSSGASTIGKPAPMDRHPIAGLTVVPCGRS